MRYIELPQEINGVVRLIGDIHGQVENIPADNSHADHFIFLGDIGVGFRNPHVDEELADMLEKTQYLEFYKSLHRAAMAGSGNNENVHLWLIRGNHDNPGYWNGESKIFLEIYEQLPTNVKSHLHFLEDEMLIINGEKWWVLSGGVSIDVYRRTEGCSYWKNEEIREPIGFEDTEVTGVISHVGPKPPAIKLKGTALVDRLIEITGEHLRESINREEAVIKSYFQMLKPKKWIYGHWHVSETFIEDGCTHVVLDAGHFNRLLGTESPSETLTL